MFCTSGLRRWRHVWTWTRTGDRPSRAYAQSDSPTGSVGSEVRYLRCHVLSELVQIVSSCKQVRLIFRKSNYFSLILPLSSWRKLASWQRLLLYWTEYNRLFFSDSYSTKPSYTVRHIPRLYVCLSVCLSVCLCVTLVVYCIVSKYLKVSRRFIQCMPTLFTSSSAWQRSHS